MIGNRDKELISGFRKDGLNWVKTIEFAKLSNALPVTKFKDSPHRIIDGDIVLVFLTSSKIFYCGPISQFRNTVWVQQLYQHILFGTGQEGKDGINGAKEAPQTFCRRKSESNVG